jgi:hypothetical protein
MSGGAKSMAQRAEAVSHQLLEFLEWAKQLA